MASKRERRIRRKARAQLRELQRRLDDVASWRPVFLAAVAYVDEIYYPNIREPFSIANRRRDLIEAVLEMRARRVRAVARAQQATRRAA